MTIAIMSAMHEESASIVSSMKITHQEQVGSRTYHIGDLDGNKVVVVFSHWGKVAAAITATCLINRYDVEEIIFTGVAGAITGTLSVGDVVIADSVYQHDMDASPIIPQHEIPLLGRADIKTSATIRENLFKATNEFLTHEFPQVINTDTWKLSPSVSIQDIASGDQFISDQKLAGDIATRLPGVACVEMEGAAVAQVCESFNIPFGLVRTISDSANDKSAGDFMTFVSDIARVYSHGIIKRYLAVSRPE